VAVILREIFLVRVIAGIHESVSSVLAVMTFLKKKTYQIG